MYDEKDIAGEEESVTGRRDVASLKSLSQLFPCHPFPNIKSFPPAVHTFN